MKAFICFTTRCVLFVILCMAGGRAFAQNDSLKLTISQADKIFLEHNLYLLAGELNVSVQKAGEIQARVYPNPAFSAEINARDPENDQWFHIGSTGQKAFSIEQTILLGGKRKNEIALAKQNTAQAQLMLEDLLRNLRQQLHNSLYSVYFDQYVIAKYNSQLARLDTIIDAYEVQAGKGNVALKEVVRLKSIYLEVNNNKTELMKDMQEEQKNLQILLQTAALLSPDMNIAEWDKFTYLPSVDSLLQLAEQYRPDWKMADVNKEIANLNLKYQRSLAVPDIAVGASYDQRGGAFGNQVNLTFGMPLPLWNRNQGNIHAAKTQQQLSDVQKQTTQTEIAAQVTAAWYNMSRSIQDYQKLKKIYNSDFNEVFDGVTSNFVKRNISVLEFVDFFEAYNESLTEVGRIRKQVAISAEQINYSTGYQVYQ